MVPNETEGEQFQEALARVCRCVGGGAATENADSDSDIELVADSVTVNLRCPVSESIHFCTRTESNMGYVVILDTTLFLCVCDCDQSKRYQVFSIYLQMSGSRIRIAGRFKPCVHLKCFDLEAFIELNHRSRKVVFLEPFLLTFVLCFL